MIGLNESGVYGRLHVGPGSEMTAAAPSLPPGVKLVHGLEALLDELAVIEEQKNGAVPPAAGDTPTAGIWALLHPACPWRRVFVSGWVPVTRLHAQQIVKCVALPGWVVDLPRTTALQQAGLAKLLADRGLGTAEANLCSFIKGIPPGMFADFVTRVHDFDTGSHAEVEIFKGGSKP